jgi:hypothetical protein
VQVLADQLVHVAVERRGEQHALAVLRGQVEDGADLGHEAHVGHLVGLVQRGEAHVGQVAGALADVVRQAARRRDQEVDTTAQRVDLTRERRAADDHAGRQAERAGVRGEGFLDLHRELTGGHQDQCARHERLGPLTREAGQQCQTERQRLAGARLAATEHVPAREGVGQRGGLDREG